ncbi:MAG: sugar ABC transporter substrate-binding protein [Alphaproteobacteria bacterium]|nr:sugar ABC transporter substrate-binding protein [Alphaproteobacteria bacterium]
MTMFRTVAAIGALTLGTWTSIGQAQDFDAWAENVRAANEGKEVVVAVASHPSVEAFKTMIPAFEEATGIKVTLDEMEEGQLGQKLTLEVSSGTTSYDAVMTAIERNPKVASAGYIEPLEPWLNDPEKTPDWFDYADILPAYSDMFLWDGQHYAIPFAGETVFLFYRKDLFEKHGLSVPSTYDELLETAAFFDDNEDNVNGVSFRARLGWEFTYTWSIFLFPFDGRMVDPETGKPDLTAPGTAASLDYMRKLAEHAPVGVESYSFPEAWDAFMLGKAAMMVEASAAAPEVENPDKSLVAGNVGYAPLPAGPAGAFSGVWGWGLGMTAASENKDATWALITYLTGRGTQDDYLANGGIPSRSSSLGDSALQAELPYYGATLDTLKQAAALNEKGLGVVLPLPEWGQFSDIMGTDGARAFIGEIPVDEAVTSMQAQAEDLLGK